MHDAAAISAVLELRASGLGARRIAARTGIPISTVQEWIRGGTPRAGCGPRCGTCGAEPHTFADLPREYVYLLGVYLGDGYVAPHPRGVQKLRVFLDAKYDQIIDECTSAIRAVRPKNRVGRVVWPRDC